MFPFSNMVLALAVCTTLGISFIILATRIFNKKMKKPKSDRNFIPSLSGKHVLITGASTGIGLSLSKKSLQEGAFVTLVARKRDKLEEAARFLVKEVQCSPNRILTKIADVGDYAAIARVIEEALTWRPIDVLICNAGITRSGFFEDVSVEDLNAVVQTNLLGTVYPVHAALPSLKERSRSHPVAIVFIGSLASLAWLYGSSVYTGTKHAVKGIAESLAMELVPFNMRVNLVCPGFVESAFLDDVSTDPELVEGMRWTCLYDRRRAESADEVAKTSIAGIKAGSFLITTTPYLGSLIAVLTRGFIPSESFVTNFLEAIACFTFRLVTSLVTIGMKWQLIKIHKKSNKP
jgi:3-dehydrosphinganine reductase